MLFAFIDFMLGIMNIVLYMTNGTFISAFMAGCCFCAGIAILLDKIFDKFLGG